MIDAVKQTSDRRRLLVAAVIVVMCGLAAVNAYWFAERFPDEIEYWNLAKNLVRSGMLTLDGVIPSAYRPPLVAWILAPVAATGVSVSVARVLFVVFFGVSGVLSAVFLRRLFPGRAVAAAIGTAFVLCNPLYFFAAGNLFPQEVLTPLFLAALLCACIRAPSFWKAIIRAGAIGACTAASLLASAASLFSLIPIWILLCLEDFRALKERHLARASGVVVAAAVVVVSVSPYIYRNYRDVHPGVYLSLNSGVNLLLGNSPNTTPYSGVDVNLSGIKEKLPGESEFDANRRLTRLAVQNIEGHPGYYAELYVRKFLAGFRNRVATVTHGYSGAGSLVFQMYMIFVWAGVVLLAFFRIRQRPPTGPFHATSWTTLYLMMWLVLAAYLSNLAGYAVFFNRLRFRMPLDVALSLISAAGWALTLLRWARGRPRNIDR
jgi:hypothetical protein